MHTVTRAMLLSVASLVGAASGCDAGLPDEVIREPVVTPARFDEPPPRIDLGPEALALYRRTLVRDPAPSCAELVEDLDEPTEALLEVVDRTTAPPSAGMRAAQCLIRQSAAEIEPQMTRWVRHRATMGFCLLVLGELDRMEPALAERLARAALAGENAEQARARVGQPTGAIGTMPASRSRL